MTTIFWTCSKSLKLSTNCCLPTYLPTHPPTLQRQLKNEKATFLNMRISFPPKLKRRNDFWAFSFRFKSFATWSVELLSRKDDGCIGLSGKLLCLRQTPKFVWHMYGNIRFMFDCWTYPTVHRLLIKSSMIGVGILGVAFIHCKSFLWILQKNDRKRKLLKWWIVGLGFEPTISGFAHFYKKDLHIFSLKIA